MTVLVPAGYSASCTARGVLAGQAAGGAAELVQQGVKGGGSASVEMMV